MLPFITISAPMARLPFHGCEKDYIKQICKGVCCHSSISKSGIIVSVLPEEEAGLKKLGAEIKGGLIQAIDRRCPFKTIGTELCSLHNKGLKPFGCRISPFSLNNTGTLIIRNRYRLIRCYNKGPKIPAYVAFKSSLIELFGDKEYQDIKNAFDSDLTSYTTTINEIVLHKLRMNEGLKRRSDAS